MGTLRLSGPLPFKLGNLTKLKELLIDSSGVSGDVPSTFANLKNLETPRFQGNSFGGPIPSSFSNLTNLIELRISDLLNGRSSLAFIRNIKSLTILDLSFNNLSKQIPSSLFNLGSLASLFLGNNKLTGTLPINKSENLLYIDVSYNNLSGSIPSWIIQQNLQLNLVANNFTLESNNSVLPHGLNCLQRSFPCNRGSPIYGNLYWTYLDKWLYWYADSSFAVNCGGPQFTSSDKIVYEMEDETLGPARYYVTGTNRWGTLFQTARVSASSLRYYGLGLDNGNYTVTLQFAEIPNLDTTGWQSFGRRVFDIYVQGNHVEKDFDIRRVAGGVPRRVVKREYMARVSENCLEIHLFWAGKGTCCLPYVDFQPTVRPPSQKNTTGLIVGIIVGVGVVFLLLLAVFFIVRRRRPQAGDDELLGMGVRPYTFSYDELSTTTEGFNPANKLGE
ncbi:hypothetical protein Pint_18458 [Pistacia integerrima]|uniref:Uncharacterized protein n=1 Tax=Pistacia integerrima TaxID=434235 RepID=A0ACC0YZF3_9ROSI|nr:hypothetical protein Pint_18458 [Pistacia integerrima]